MTGPVMMPVIYATKPHWRQYDIIFVRLEWSVALMRNTHLRNIQLVYNEEDNSAEATPISISALLSHINTRGSCYLELFTLEMNFDGWI